MAYLYLYSHTSHSHLVGLLLMMMMVTSPATVWGSPHRVRPQLATQGRMIRIAGKLLERTSQRPLRHATIMVKCGDMVLANRQSDEAGEFLIFIPPEKVSREHLSIKIKYQNHVFIKDLIDPISQELLIEINGAVFLESTPIKDYQLPMHELGSPQVGRVLIRTGGRPTGPASVEIVRT
jgi:hypothetical protein